MSLRWINSSPPNFPFTINSESLQSRGLAAWWPMRASRGSGTLLNLVDRGEDGALLSGTSWVGDGQRGAVLDFDGTTSTGVTTGTGVLFDTALPFSFAAWVHVNAFTNSNATIASLNRAGTSDYIFMQVIDDRFRLWGTGVPDSFTPDGEGFLNAWRHIALTYNGGGESTLSNYTAYIDGVVRSLSGTSGGTGSGSTNLIGHFTHSTAYFDGLIDDVRIYNRELSGGEVYHIYAPDTRWDLYRPLPRIFPVLVSGAVIVTPSVSVLTWTAPAPTVTGAATATSSVSVLTWTAPAPTVTGAATATPSVTALTWTAPAVTVEVVSNIAFPDVTALVWASPAPAVTGAAVVVPSSTALIWASPSPVATGQALALPSVSALTWISFSPAVTGVAVVSPSVTALVWTAPDPTVSGVTTVEVSVSALIWSSLAPTVVSAANVTPSVTTLIWVAAVARAGTVLSAAQATLGGIPSISLTIGAHDLSTYVRAYHYEEISQDQGYLSIWLDNRADAFDDISTDWPNLVRGAAVLLERGLVVAGTAETEKLPRTWVESLQYDREGTLLLTCIDMWGLLETFRYAADTTFSASTHAATAALILNEVGLTLDVGSFGFSTDFEVAIHDDADEAVIDLMDQCHEVLYVGLDAAVKWKALDPAEAAIYTYDFGNGDTGYHPLLFETEISENSPRYNKITVLGGADLEYSGSAEDTTESSLVGTRLRTIEETNISSDAEAAEYALAELRQEQAEATAATLVARPHFDLRMYDVVFVNQAPPWGGPTVTGRVIEIVEDYDSTDGTWEQEIVIGDLFRFALVSVEDRDDSGGGGGKRGGGGRRKSRRRRRSSSKRKRRSSSKRRKSASGSGVSHSSLADLGADVHPLYSLVDGTRPFTGTVGGVDPVADSDLVTKQYHDNAVLSHSLLSDLDADDHTQYSLVDGTRAFTGTVGGVDPVAATDLVTKRYQDNVVMSACGGDAAPPGAPSTGDRYVVGVGATGAWSGQDGDIATWNGSSWDFSTPAAGTQAWSTADGAACAFDGSTWGSSASLVDHGGLLGLADDDHTQYTRKDTLTTKGDIYAATAGATPARLAVGAADGQVLTVDSAQSTGMVWASSSALVPVGGIILWSGSVGSIPANWALCDGGSGTPDLRDRFVVGAGSTYGVGATGGSVTKDLQHDHNDGSLATDSDNHSHDVTGSTASDSHSHGDGSLATDSDSHTHDVTGSVASDAHTHDVTGSTASEGHSHTSGTLDVGGPDSVESVTAGGVDVAAEDHFHTISGSTASDSHSHADGTLAAASDSHSHGDGTLATDSDNHSHDVTGSAASDSHSHDDGSLATDSDSHSHDVTGSTANALSTTEDILPPYYALAFIMRVS